MMLRNSLYHIISFIKGYREYRYHNDINKIFFMTHDEILNYQSDKLKLLLSEIHKNKYYYFNDKIPSYDNYQEIEDPYSLLELLPLLEKEVVRDSHKKIQIPLWQKMKFDWRSTSGSTGLPCGFYKSGASVGYMQALQNCAFLWHGIQAEDLQAYFWGGRDGISGKLAALKDFMKNRIRLSAFDLSREAFLGFYEKIFKAKPSYLYGYPSLIIEFIRFLKKERLTFQKIPLKAVIGTGEYIFPHERNEIEDFCNTVMVSEYGCTEIGLISFSCEFGNNHVLSPNVMVEIHDQKGCRVINEIGDVVVTELNSNFFPFLRYKIGDRGKVRENFCDCGRVGPILDIFESRKDSYVLTPEGKKIYDAIFAYNLKDGIEKFFVVQDAVDHILIEIVPSQSFNEKTIPFYVDKFNNILSCNISYDFKVVNSISRKPSGKMSYFTSEIGDVDD